MKVRVYDSNIRLHAIPKNFQVHEKPWTERRVQHIASIKEHTDNVANSIVCMQEVLYDQLIDIAEGLKSEWTYVGYGRDDGETKGEFTPIFYRKAEWTLKSSSATWLSDTPEKASMGWGAHIYRIVTYAELQSTTTHEIVHVFNTHFDHESLLARTESAKLLVKLVENLEAKLGDSVGPVIITGDFNATLDEECYSIMSAKLTDASKVTGVVGPVATYIGFDYETTDDDNIIDYVWINDNFSVARFEVVHPGYRTPNTEDSQLRFSDHRVLLADVDTK